MIGTLIASFAVNVYAFVAGRLLIGFAIGMGAYTAPLYIAEVAPFELRGAISHTQSVNDYHRHLLLLSHQLCVYQL